MIGKLKKSINERCPLCGSVLQIRVYQNKTLQKGNEIYVDEEYIACSNPNCDYEREIPKKKRKNRKSLDLDIPSSFE